MSAKPSPIARSRAFHRLLRVEPMRRIAMVRKGLPASAVQAAADYLAMSRKDLLSAIRISISALTLRARTRKPLSAVDSDKLIRLAEVVKRAMEVFGDDDEGKVWLKDTIVSLGDRRPVDFLDTHDGFDLVMRTLGQIQCGAPA